MSGTSLIWSKRLHGQIRWLVPYLHNTMAPRVLPRAFQYGAKGPRLFSSFVSA